MAQMESTVPMELTAETEPLVLQEPKVCFTLSSKVSLMKNSK